MKKIKIPTPKGNIAAVVHYPKNKTDKLAILCPGYLDTKDYNHLKILAEDLVREGYTTVRFDPIGTWESDGDISDYTTSEYLNNVGTVLDYMLQQNNFKHILIGGHSRGGMVSILYAARDRRITEVLAIMPSRLYMRKTDERVIEAEKTGFSTSSRDLPEDSKLKREYRVPYSHFEDNLRYNVVRLDAVKSIEMPFIIAAGELDDLEPPESVREIYNNANEPKKFIVIKGIGHDYRHNPSEIRIVNSEILKTLKNYEKN